MNVGGSGTGTTSPPRLLHPPQRVLGCHYGIEVLCQLYIVGPGPPPLSEQVLVDALGGQ